MTANIVPFALYLKRILLPTFSLVLFNLIIITGGGWTLGYKFFWIFSYLIYIPLSIRISFCILLVLAWFSLYIKPINLSISILQRIDKGRSLWLFTLPLWAFLFWYFRESTPHGDALFKLYLLENSTLRDDLYIWKEPLDSLINYSLTKALAQNLQLISPREIVAGLSVVAGLIYAVSCGILATTLTQDRVNRWIIYLTLMITPASQLWFGHIENYSLVTAFTYLSIALAILYIKGKVPIFIVGFMAGLAVSFHPQALFAVPALIFVLSKENIWKSLALISCGFAVVPLLVMLILVINQVPLPDFSSSYAGDTQLFLSIQELASAKHLRDTLNNFLLIAPTSILFGVLISYELVRRRSFSILGNNQIWLYLTAVNVGLLIYFFSFQNDLARWHDWDLFAIVGPIILLWSVYSWLQLEPKNWHYKHIIFAMSFVSIVTIFWIGVNHTFTLIAPSSTTRHLYERYLHHDLSEDIEIAAVIPNTPVCNGPGCERVGLTEFEMPQSGDRRATILAHAPAKITFPVLNSQHEFFLWSSSALDPNSWNWGGDGVEFRVSLKDNGFETSENLLWQAYMSPQVEFDQNWKEIFVDLSMYSNKPVDLVFETTPGPANDNSADRSGWGYVWIMNGTLDNRFIGY